MGAWSIFPVIWEKSERNNLKKESVKAVEMCDCFFIMRIYNTRQWLAEAIESVLNQTNPSLRLFLFDNGSTDGCKEICEYYKNKDDRVFLYRTEDNRHYSDLESHAVIRDAFLRSGARYFSFLDSDDRYDEKYLETMLQVAKNENADIVVAGWERIDCGGNLLNGKVEPMPAIIDKRNISFKEISSLFGPFHTMWNKLYRAEMYPAYWYAIQMLPKNASNGGDFYMMRYILSEADRIVCISNVLHQWRHRHRENTYTPVIDNSWLYLAPMRNYVENQKFLSKFNFNVFDAKRSHRLIGKLAYADMKFVCEAIENDNRENAMDKKMPIFREIISHEDAALLIGADWRIPIVLYNWLVKFMQRKNICSSEMEKLENIETWKMIKSKSGWMRRMLFGVREKLVTAYVKRIS